MPAYLVIVDLRSGEPVADEALARLIDPSGRVIAAGYFIEAAEGINLIHAVDEAVSRQTTSLGDMVSEAEPGPLPPIHPVEIEPRPEEPVKKSSAPVTSNLASTPFVIQWPNRNSCWNFPHNHRRLQPKLSRLENVMLRLVNRDQLTMAQIDVEHLIDEHHPARGIWEVIGKLDLSEYESAIRTRKGEAGRAAWSPQLLIAVWLYGYSEGITSARELERQMDYEPGLMWLSGMEVIRYPSWLTPMSFSQFGPGAYVDTIRDAERSR